MAAFAVGIVLTGFAVGIVLTGPSFTGLSQSKERAGLQTEGFCKGLEVGVLTFEGTFVGTQDS
jgi:hypothetical protein